MFFFESAIDFYQVIFIGLIRLVLLYLKNKLKEHNHGLFLIGMPKCVSLWPNPHSSHVKSYFKFTNSHIKHPLKP